MKPFLILSVFALLAACVATDVPVVAPAAAPVAAAAANPNLPGWPAPALPFDERLVTEVETIGSPVTH